MRLTYVLPSPTFGMHQYTADLANRMAEHFDVQVVTSVHHPPDRYGPRVSVKTPLSSTNSGLSLESLRVGQLRRITRELGQLRPDIVHITGPHLWNIWLVDWLNRNGVPVIHTIHDLDPHHGASYGRLLRVWNRAIIQSADHIVVHGDIYRQRLIEGGLDASKVSCTPLTHLFVGYQAGVELAASRIDVTYEPMVLFFGRQERYKGVDILIRAFERLVNRLSADQAGHNPRLILAGPGNEGRDLREHSLATVEWRNHLVGDQEAVELFRRCSVVVLPYRDATQSAVIAAAYYFRKPVIVTAVGALTEYVQPGKTGLVIEHKDAEESLAQAMFEVLLRPGYKVILGEAGRAWYDEQRSWESQYFTGLYQGMVD